MTDVEDIEGLVDALAARSLECGLFVVTAESCSGGWIAKVITDRAGSSDWFRAGVVAYHDSAKTRLLGVSPGLIGRHGAVSEAVAEAMARGALAATGGDLAVAVTGVAGPSGGSEETPVGTVWFAWASAGSAGTECCRFDGDREAVRIQTVVRALAGLIELAGAA